eukprot:scaffold300386_cov30-Tisochrysis_lutea.AAC.3
MFIHEQLGVAEERATAARHDANGHASGMRRALHLIRRAQRLKDAALITRLHHQVKLLHHLQRACRELGCVVRAVDTNACDAQHLDHARIAH